MTKETELSAEEFERLYGKTAEDVIALKMTEAVKRVEYFKSTTGRITPENNRENTFNEAKKACINANSWISFYLKDDPDSEYDLFKYRLFKHTDGTYEICHGEEVNTNQKK